MYKLSENFAILKKILIVDTNIVIILFEFNKYIFFSTLILSKIIYLY